MSKRKQSVAALAAPVFERRTPWPPEPLRINGACSFYYEGGHGERYWSGGWHYGIIREVPTKGQHKNWMRIELPVDHYAVETDPKGNRIRRAIPREKVWVHSYNVNEVWDFVYHGPRLVKIVAARVEAKAKDIKSAKRKARVK